MGRVERGKKRDGLRVGKRGKGCGLEKGEGEVLRVGKVLRMGRIKGGVGKRGS